MAWNKDTVTAAIAQTAHKGMRKAEPINTALAAIANFINPLNSADNLRASKVKLQTGDILSSSGKVSQGDSIPTALSKTANNIPIHVTSSDHDGTYSKIGHSHLGGVYFALANLTHTHLGTYSPSDHDHDDLYSLTAHVHAEYAPLAHTHGTWVDFSGTGVSNGKRLDTTTYTEVNGISYVFSAAKSVPARGLNASDFAIVARTTGGAFPDAHRNCGVSDVYVDINDNLRFTVNVYSDTANDNARGKCLVVRKDGYAL